MLTPFYNNPTIVLYLLQASTYGAAAALSRHEGHGALSFCYLTSALLHGLLASWHLLHLG